ncbi:MAG: S-layer homology domain-containing protein, partial [Propionibacteriaceae bacterium]|nr:S-layer homology domain-containing protein [Propionibacteriaceae bacterium]
MAELPFGGGSEPYLIGVVGDQNTVAPGAPLNLELDLSKPVQAGTLTITGPSGTPVATLKTPASTDGSLRGLTWTPPAGAPSGTYTWTLNVTDNTGQAAVNNIGNGAPSGTFTVKNCTPFTDVPATYQFASSICWASANGITKGTGDGTTYSPANPVNRGSMAAFLYRLAGSPTWKPPT